MCCFTREIDDAILEASALRAQRDYAAARERLLEVADDARGTKAELIILLQLFYTSRESGADEQARGIAVQISAIDSEIPTVSEFLD